MRHDKEIIVIGILIDHIFERRSLCELNAVLPREGSDAPLQIDSLVEIKTYHMYLTKISRIIAAALD
jgi:hypothetical protein